MRQAVLLPEMIQAGAEAFMECRSHHNPAEVAVAIYLAMEAIREIAEIEQDNETVH